MPCTHAGPFTCSPVKYGWVWHCLTCEETSRPYCTKTDCLMDFTRLSRKLQKEEQSRRLSN